MRREGTPLRRLLAETILHVLPIEYIGATQAVGELDEVMKQGPGVIVACNHFSDGDHTRLAAYLVTRSPMIAKRPITAPVSLHQYNARVKIPARIAGVTLSPIVTKNTKEQKGWSEDKMGEEERRQMFARYLTDSRSTLEQGGLVILSPQARRKPTLGEPPKGKPMKLLLEENHANSNGLYIVVAGLGIKGQERYDDPAIKGINPGTIYTLNMTHPVSIQELMKLSGNDLEHVDETVFDLMKQVVPPEYV